QHITALDAWFFRYISSGTAGVSPECGIQVRQLAGPQSPFFEYRAQFRREEFRSELRKHNCNPFRVIFAGRAERSKGILDIADMAEQIRMRSVFSVVFEVCGDGGGLSELRRLVEQKRLQQMVFIYGQIPRPELLQVYARAHAVIVPTRRKFREGLPKVCAEAILSNLPVITSRVSNALQVLGPAVLEAEVENIQSYVDAILKLVEDRALYERLSASCPKLALQFFDRSQSYVAAMDRLIAHVFPSWTVLDDYQPIFARVR